MALGYLLSRYTSRYLEKDIRTVNTVKHEDSYEIPSLLLCSTALQWGKFYCYKNQPMGPKVTREFCEDKYLINTRVEYKMSTLNWTPGRPLGDGCYAVDFDSSKTFYEQSTFKVAFNSSDPSDALDVQVVSLSRKILSVGKLTDYQTDRRM